MVHPLSSVSAQTVHVQPGPLGPIGNPAQLHVMGVSEAETEIV